MKIIWTEKARKENKNCIDSIISNQGKDFLLSYLNRLDSLIKHLSINPNIGEWDREIKSSKLSVTKQIVLFYDIFDGQIVIRSFWNNYEKPLFL
jgi:plasmid stabilization system protein ParE